MKFRHIFVPLVLVTATVVARAESTDSPAVATPKSPAPAPAVSADSTTAPHRIIYTQRLPTAADLTAVAAAQKLVISKIEIAPTQVTVTWRAADAPPVNVAYRLLSSINATTQDTVDREPPRRIYYEPFFPGYYGYGYRYPFYSVGFHGSFGGHRGRWH